MRMITTIAAGGACLLLGACQYTPGIANQTVAFNEGVADSTNRILVLNTLRARDRMPTYYTRATGDTANAGVGPGIGFSIPLGPNASNRGYGSSVTVGGSTQHLVAMQNLDDKRFINGVLQPLKLEVLEFYMGQGWPSEVLFTLSVARISLKRADAETLITAFEAECGRDPRSDYCNAVLPDGLAPSGPGQLLAQRLRACLPAGPGGRLNLRNYPSDVAGTACFKDMLRVISALGPTAHKIKSYDLIAEGLSRDRNDASTIADFAKTDLVIGEGADKATYVVCRKSSIEALNLRKFASDTQTAFVTADGDSTIKACGGRAAKEIGAGHKTIEIQFATRSLDGMIYYLGELLRANDPRVGDVWVWSGPQQRFATARLFVVEPGKSKNSAVVVRFRNKKYSVPATDPNHRSLQVVSLLSQVWGLQKEQLETPSAAAVIVGG